jgi:hypothetical protein
MPQSPPTVPSHDGWLGASYNSHQFVSLTAETVHPGRPRLPHRPARCVREAVINQARHERQTCDGYVAALQHNVSLVELSSVALMLISLPISRFNNRPKEDHADQERYCPYRRDNRQFRHERASFRDRALCLSDLDYENVKVNGDNVSKKVPPMVGRKIRTDALPPVDAPRRESAASPTAAGRDSKFSAARTP